MKLYRTMSKHKRTPISHPSKFYERDSNNTQRKRKGVEKKFQSV